MALSRFIPALLLVLVLLPRDLAAHPFDTYGFTSRAIALGGAATAAATDVDAAYYNPAAAVRARSFTLATGLLVADEFLKHSSGQARIAPIVHYQMGLATPLPLGRTLRDRLFVTIAASLPHHGFYDVRQPDDEALVFPFWDARNRRVVLTGGLAGRVTDWLAVGVGFSLLPNVLGEVQVDLMGNRGDNSTRVQVRYDFAPTAGLLVTPWHWLSVALTYRGGHATNLDLPVDVNVIDDLPPIFARLTGPAYFVPHEVALGVALSWREILTLALDVTWHGYRRFRYSSPNVTLYDTSGAVIQESPAATSRFYDTFVPRAGVEWRALSFLLVRGGYAFVPSPVGYQSGVTNLLDSHRSVVSAGVGFDVPGEYLWEGVSRLAVDLHAQMSFLWQRGFEKHSVMVGNPGYPTVSFSGGTYSLGLSARLWF